MNGKLSRLELAAQLAENTKENVEMLKLLLKLDELDKVDVQPDSQLKRKAVEIAVKKGIYTPRHVNKMTYTELEEWCLAQNF
ncbi:hypothetical protein Ava_1939 [Trichormus variabilis ATCC 29413]|uniref:Uncharacterized protein n=2 Tax=Anabaena variabilis TaxID=264691 RepID=Q3MBS5_TRIV2|nr:MULTISPECIES: hypothetical protein [Nostocaceae]ABA21561.1 hypothetical protein Ava_1939 [Trichormus variabilis ATCC 29413]MBC1214522.1 hypothetical protein [Trichormus variabilis ARAD]MBC1256214.1 hypothetical protein [Trichormus variabilis V5]MBC1269505.1 hypothetical protein [Trichormus variabilis FSR]MBC1301612.1 hypothetical protein [Trichormus variabilis N2B]